MAVKVTINTINIDKLKMLDEDVLRKSILLPLLAHIEVQNIIDMHGSSEKGIDIYFETCDAFGHRRRFGVQIKNKDIVCTSQPNKVSIITIINQIKMTFSRRIKFGTSDKGNDGVHIDGFYVITSGKVIKEAADWIFENRNTYSYIQIVDGGELMEIIKNKDELKRRNSSGFIFSTIKSQTGVNKNE
jgi:hypothetical protein